jgi:cell division protein FtsB
VRIRALEREIAAAERDIAALRSQAKRLTEAIDRLRNDPAYIEKLGREEHGLVRQGETILKFPPKPK